MIDGANRDPLPPAVADALAHLSADDDLACPDVHRLPGGLQGGVWLLESGSGRRLVLKTTTGEQLLARRDETTALVNALVRHGYPTPHWEHSGITATGVGYVVMSVAEGSTPTWDALDLPRLLDAIELQAGVAGPSASTWSDYALAVVSEDSDAIRTLRQAGDATGAVADEALALVDRLGPITLPRQDAVHGDMGLGNLLVGPTGQLSIIDIDACGPGTRAIDHAWLYREAITESAPSSAARMIRRSGEAAVGADAFRFLVTVACCELLAFQVRRRPAAAGDPRIEALRICMGSLG